MSELSIHLILYSLTYLPVCIIAVSLTVLMFKPRDARWGHILGIEIAVVIFMIVMERVFTLMSFTLSSVRYDEYLYLIDRKLFGAPSFFLATFLNSHLSLNSLMEVVYGNFLIPVRVLIFLYFLGVTISAGRRMMLAFVYNIVLALPWYIIIPAAGPKYAFSSFPEKFPVVYPHPVILSAFPNCMPSVHMSTALLIAIFLWRWEFGKVFAIVWVILTMIATLGLGEHYAIDLIAAVPHALTCLWLAGLTLKECVAVNHEASNSSNIRILSELR